MISVLAMNSAKAKCTRLKIVALHTTKDSHVDAHTSQLIIYVTLSVLYISHTIIFPKKIYKWLIR